MALSQPQKWLIAFLKQFKSALFKWSAIKDHYKKIICCKPVPFVKPNEIIRGMVFLKDINLILFKTLYVNWHNCPLECCHVSSVLSISVLAGILQQHCFQCQLVAGSAGSELYSSSSGPSLHCCSYFSPLIFVVCVLT